MITLYHAGQSPLHRLPAGIKLLGLMAFGTLLFLLENLWLSCGAFAGVLVLFFVGQIPARKLVEQIKPVMIILLVIFLAQGFLNGWELATLVVVRFAALILCASLVTFTTMTSHMVAAIERALTPFSAFVSVEKVSLAISLSIRFIPVIAGLTKEVRAAQRARGMDRSIFAVAMPVIIRTLKMGTQIAEALDARSFGNEPADRGKNS